MKNSQTDISLNVLSKARNLYQLRSYRQAAELIRNNLSDLSLDGFVLLIRCELEQGSFLSAKAALLLAKKKFRQGSNDLYEINLLDIFLDLFILGDVTKFLNQTRKIIFRLEKLEKNKKDLAFALDLYARGLSIAISWKIKAPDELQTVRNYFQRAALEYSQAGFIDESLGCKLREAQGLITQEVNAELVANQLLSEVLCQAEQSKNLPRLAEAKWRMGLLEMQRDLKSQANRNLNSTIINKLAGNELILEAKSILIELGDMLTPIEIDLKKYQLLFEYGVNVEKNALLILEQYQKIEYSLGLIEVSALLGMLYFNKRDFAASAKYRNINFSYANKMGFAAGMVAGQFAIADLHMRSGNYNAALPVYENILVLKRLPVMQALSRLSLANAYTLLGLENKAELVCRQAIKDLKRIKNYAALSQAYIILANIFSGRNDWDSALCILRSGIKLDEAFTNEVAVAEKIQIIIQAMVMKEYKKATISSKLKKISIQAENLGKKHIAVMEKSKLPNAVNAKAGILQSLGQICICKTDFVEALRNLGQARQLYQMLGLQMQLATTDSMISLVYRQLAGQGQVSMLAEADWHSRQAAAYFDKDIDKNQIEDVTDLVPENNIKMAH